MQPEELLKELLEIEEKMSGLEEKANKAMTVLQALHLSVKAKQKDIESIVKLVKETAQLCGLDVEEDVTPAEACVYA